MDDGEHGARPQGGTGGDRRQWGRTPSAVLVDPEQCHLVLELQRQRHVPQQRGRRMADDAAREHLVLERPRHGLDARRVVAEHVETGEDLRECGPGEVAAVRAGIQPLLPCHQGTGATVPALRHALTVRSRAPTGAPRTVTVDGRWLWRTGARSASHVVPCHASPCLTRRVVASLTVPTNSPLTNHSPPRSGSSAGC